MISSNSSSCEGCPAFKRSFVNSLSIAQIRILKENAIPLNFRRGQKIMTRHTGVQGIHCIRSGVVKYHLDTIPEKSVTVCLRTVGDQLGHHEFLTGRSIFSVTCLTDVETCFYPGKVINNMFTRVKAFSRKIVTDINKDVDEIAEFLSVLCFKSVKQRVAYAILYLNQRIGTAEDGYIALPLSRKDFSDMVCSSRESVYRELTFLQRKKYIKLKNQYIRIEDEAKLATLCNS